MTRETHGKRRWWFTAAAATLSTSSETHFPPSMPLRSIVSALLVVYVIEIERTGISLVLPAATVAASAVAASGSRLAFAALKPDAALLASLNAL